MAVMHDEFWGMGVSGVSGFLGAGAVVGVMRSAMWDVRCAGAGKGFFKSEDQLDSGDVHANKSGIWGRSFEAT